MLFDIACQLGYIRSNTNGGKRIILFILSLWGGIPWLFPGIVIGGYCLGGGAASQLFPGFIGYTNTENICWLP